MKQGGGEVQLNWHLAGRLGKYHEVAKLSLQNHLVYFTSFLWRSLFLAIIVYIFLQLWRAAYGSLGTDVVADYTLPEMLWYFMFAETIVLSYPQLSNRIDDDVKQGSIAYALGKPYSYVLYQYTTFASEVALRTLVNGCVGGLVAFWAVRSVPVSWQGLPCLVLSLFLSCTIQFCLAISIGLLAFWMEDTTATWFIYQKFLFILGGMLLPLEVYPPMLQKIAQALPLRYIVHGPARLLVKFDLSKWWELTRGQLLWVLFLSMLVTGLYRLGVQQLNVNGG
ncbi:MAG: ABC transporter permease [Firmicutes bacterium]|nr:ABC transporter permease [Bacillota bacterium]